MHAMTRAEVQFDAAAMKRLEEIPQLLQFKVLDSTLRKCAKPIVERARALAPRGNDADRKKRSKKQRDAADWNYPAHKTITYVLRKSNNSAYIVVGPSWPKGNKLHFDWGLGKKQSFENGRKQVLWGRPSGQVVKQTNHFLKQAADQSMEEVIRIFNDEINKAVAEL